MTDEGTKVAMHHYHGAESISYMAIYSKVSAYI